MERTIKTEVKGFRTIDGAGVSLVRVLGNRNVREFDPILMLDSFDSVNPDEYTKGFPLHPHRGIETISYLYKGKMVHKDSLGNEDAIGDGEIQWMNSGSGILHEEQVPAADRLLGVQLWLNLPSSEKMSKPSYFTIKNDEIKEITFDGGYLRLLSGSYREYEGVKGDHLPLDYYDIHLKNGAEIVIDTKNDASLMLFTLLGEAYIGGDLVKEKVAVKLGEGDRVRIKGKSAESQVLFISSIALKEPIAWAGPIVMNSRKELELAFSELENNTFLKDSVDY